MNFLCAPPARPGEATDVINDDWKSGLNIGAMAAPRNLAWAAPWRLFCSHLLSLGRREIPYNCVTQWS